MCSAYAPTYIGTLLGRRETTRTLGGGRGVAAPSGAASHLGMAESANCVTTKGYFEFSGLMGKLYFRSTKSCPICWSLLFEGRERQQQHEESFTCIRSARLVRGLVCLTSITRASATRSLMLRDVSRCHIVCFFDSACYRFVVQALLGQAWLRFAATPSGPSKLRTRGGR